MSYTYLQEQGEEFTAGNYSDIPPFALLKSKAIAGKSCTSANETESFQDFQYGTTSQLLMEDHGKAQLTLLPVDSLAKTSAPPAKEQDWPGSVQAYGQNLRASLERYNLNLRLSKTPLCSELAGLSPSCKTLPKWGMTHAGACWELGMRAHLIRETECGYLPTPAARDHKGSYTKEALVRKDGKHRLDALPQVVDALNGRYGEKIKQAVQSKTWPTPTKAEAGKISNQPNYGQIGLSNHPRIVGLPDRPKGKKDVAGGTKTPQKWPTPNTSDANGANLPHDVGRHYLRTEVLPAEIQKTNCTEARNHGQLNPSWVEWLMGWPIGASDLLPLETAKFRNVQPWHLIFSAKD